jgi:hypothetical protein
MGRAYRGGFRPTSSNNGKAVCGATHTDVAGVSSADYIPHHEPFQYYQSTSNSRHLPPISVSIIGYQDQANHQYDQLAGPLEGMFDFSQRGVALRRLFLDPTTGEPSLSRSMF